jgi:hypothetical protein
MIGGLVVLHTGPGGPTKAVGHRPAEGDHRRRQRGGGAFGEYSGRLSFRLYRYSRHRPVQRRGDDAEVAA